MISLKEECKMTAPFSDNRRSFLKMAVLLGTTTVGLALTAKGEAKQEHLLPQQGTTGKGYRETEHIKKYYRAARI
jgi:hypothetical protein